jgi:hypothetical protein
MNYASVVDGDIRLSILLILLHSGAYEHNQYVIRTALTLPKHAHHISMDKLRTELAWLSEQGLVTLAQGDVWAAKLTARGMDVANGIAQQPGVKRPEPEL